MSTQIDFKGLAQELLGRSRELVPSWIPGGKMRGREYVSGSIRGGDGDSFSCNLDTGLWADFADASCRGGDLISLYAQIKGMKQGEAARELAEGQGYDLTQEPPPLPPPEPMPELPPASEKCPCLHPIYGLPVKAWEYRTKDGRLMFYIARYDTADGKQIIPWSWVNKAWKMKGWPTPRPLYGLDKLQPNKPVIIVEGEKAAEAARDKLGNIYNVLTWPNGALAYSRADWTPLTGWGRVLLWEDADQPGREAMQGVAKILADMKVNEIKWIDTLPLTESGQVPEGWDAADVTNMTAKDLLNYLRGLVKVYKSPFPTVPAIIKAETVNAQNAIVQVNTTTSEDTHVSDVPESSAYWIDKLGLAVSKKGVIYNDMENGVRIVSRHPKYVGRFAFDTFYNRLQIRNDNGTYRFMEEEDLHFVLEFVQGSLGLRKYSIDDVLKAMKTTGWRNKKNEPKDWMESLKWDGTPRVAGFFRDYYVAEDNDYSKAVSTNFWVGMVARIFDPGCKLDNMVVLEGAQGTYKSTSLEVIGGKWFLNTDGNPDDKDFFINLRGKMLVEIAELDSFRKAENTVIKKILTRRFDSYRDPYGIYGRDNYRTCIFVGTTNEQEYLRDNTGARRFWPIRIGRIYLDKINDDREQLFAEAVHLYKQGVRWHEIPKELADHEQEARRITDPWEPIISAYLQGKFQVTTHEIATECLKIEVSRLEGLNQKRIVKIMRLLGWTHERKRIGLHREYVWSSPDSFNTEEF